MVTASSVKTINNLEVGKKYLMVASNIYGNISITGATILSSILSGYSESRSSEYAVAYIYVLRADQPTLSIGAAGGATPKGVGIAYKAL